MNTCVLLLFCVVLRICCDCSVAVLWRCRGCAAHANQCTRATKPLHDDGAACCDLCWYSRAERRAVSVPERGGEGRGGPGGDRGDGDHHGRAQLRGAQRAWLAHPPPHRSRLPVLRGTYTALFKLEFELFVK